MTKVMIHPASYENVRQAVDRAFEHFPLKLWGKRVLIKPNVLRETGGLILDIARKIAQEYPDIEFWETNVDAMAMWLIKNPQDYSVLVAENLEKGR